MYNGQLKLQVLTAANLQISCGTMLCVVWFSSPAFQRLYPHISLKTLNLATTASFPTPYN
jgi:hypothetical protein